MQKCENCIHEDVCEKWYYQSIIPDKDEPKSNMYYLFETDGLFCKLYRE